ncbi:hypothetical protein BUALT_Bualt06G0015300 [Buddleja alternifolia]|uniref:Uncharacterized protein n=1 Tax=Buddleja alternifolia TaxID=168488 RepID=A0AAV6XMR8_9LAMI|nr:hypothetical protein BUALT_Bualt06G0015300 [Buddleja alternifolia]
MVNPGRRCIIRKKIQESGGCNFFEFIDPPMCERSRHIISGLLRRVTWLENESEKRSDGNGKRGLLLLLLSLLYVT